MLLSWLQCHFLFQRQLLRTFQFSMFYPCRFLLCNVYVFVPCVVFGVWILLDQTGCVSSHPTEFIFFFFFFQNSFLREQICYNRIYQGTYFLHMCFSFLLSSHLEAFSSRTKNLPPTASLLWWKHTTSPQEFLKHGLSFPQNSFSSLWFSGIFIAWILIFHVSVSTISQ